MALTTMRWSWRGSFTLVWVATMAALVWTWVYAWEPFLHLFRWILISIWMLFQVDLNRLILAFLKWFPPPWLVAAWRVGITLLGLIMTALLAWSWSGQHSQPTWTTWAAWWRAGLFPFRKGYGLSRYWLHPPNLDRMVEIGDDRDLIGAFDWSGNYAPTRNGEVYEAVLKYAEASYKEISEVSANLDKKADDLMKISGAVGAALAAAGRIQGISATLTSRPVVSAVGCLVATMLICARARKPSKKVVPMTVRQVMKVVEESSLPYISEEDEEADEGSVPPGPEPAWSPPPGVVGPTANQVKATIAASYHWAITGTQYVIEWKARLIKVATFVFCLALIMLMIGFQGPLW